MRLLRRYGVGRFHDQLRALGMTTLFRPADDYGLTLVLGGAEGTLEELTGIYARLIATARDGQAAPVTRLAGITPVAEPLAISPGAAWLTLDALRDVARPGTARQWRLYRSSQPIAWKTGTSYGLRDAWAIGSNGRYTVGVWAGNGNGEPAPHLGGADTAAPLMLDVFSLLGPAPFPEPPLNDLKQVRVCADDGYLAGGRCKANTVLAPLHGHFQTVTPHHRRVHLDGNGQRVHGGCEAVAAMQSRDWFVLPPAQAWFYRQRHPDYRPLPAWRSDCLAGARALDADPPMAVLYPHAGAGLYIPGSWADGAARRCSGWSTSGPGHGCSGTWTTATWGHRALPRMGPARRPGLAHPHPGGRSGLPAPAPFQGARRLTLVTLHLGRIAVWGPFRERREPIPGAPGLTSCQTGSRKGPTPRCFEVASRVTL